MTMVIEIEKKCTLCGKTSIQKEVLSVFMMGPSDLDTRAPYLDHSLLSASIQRCPYCGYCAPDISEPIENAEEIIHSKSYQEQLTNSEFPKLASSFLCFSLIQERFGDYVAAGEAAMRAAWTCDDVGNDKAAQKCRRKAVSLLQKAKDKGQKFGTGPGVGEAIMADLLRRAGDFEEALKLCEEGLKKNPEKIAVDVLEFEKLLIAKRDTFPHTVREAIDYRK